MPHLTLTDSDGNKYKVVSSNWLKVTLGIAVFNFLILIGITAALLDNVQAVQNALSITEKVSQRNAALSDIAASRAVANIWAFEKTCELIKKQGQECLPNPKWYADPAKYPLIANDIAGVGLFPPKENK